MVLIIISVPPPTYFNWNGTEITGLTSEGESLTEIYIPEYCTSIGKSAFRGKKFNLVVIPPSVEKIDTNAFSSLSSSMSIKIYSTKLQLSSSAFQSMSFLKNDVNIYFYNIFDINDLDLSFSSFNLLVSQISCVLHVRNDELKTKIDNLKIPRLKTNLI